MCVPAGAVEVEQTAQGERQPTRLIVSFDGLGCGFEGRYSTTIEMTESIADRLRDFDIVLRPVSLNLAGVQTSPARDKRFSD